MHFSVCSTEDVAAAADAEKEHMLKLGLHDFALNDVDVNDDDDDDGSGSSSVAFGLISIKPMQTLL